MLVGDYALIMMQSNSILATLVFVTMDVSDVFLAVGVTRRDNRKISLRFSFFIGFQTLQLPPT